MRMIHLVRAAAMLLISSLAACAVFQHSEETTQVIVNRRLVGMSIGDFFETFGSPRNRTEMLDGSTAFDWKSRSGAVPAGFAGLDDLACTLRIVADKRGRIATADVVRDDPGRVSSSRCGELFEAK
jgi:hypothetical protein